MPRTYQRTVRKKPLAKYTDDRINSALEGKTSELNPGKNIKPQGGQTILSKNVEQLIVESLITCSSWGYPLTTLDLRTIVKSYLDTKGTNIKKFKYNMRGIDFAMCFLRRHRDTLSQRLCQNIKKSRTQVSRKDLNEYFNNLEHSLNNIPPSNILNYDETNLSDDQERIKVISKRGCKYPERVMNHKHFYYNQDSSIDAQKLLVKRIEVGPHYG
ncbi:DDE-1 domain-containing protein [Aphis craccivora]|uniref:DDE-1 domain-containing protein n=1 Tax=Aphis craccivora TaxID=307492 RepID=A0A6G0WST0_APHCR|nr:DDE-1 domain-containing protein [Aphis craccivora]